MMSCASCGNALQCALEVCHRHRTGETPLIRSFSDFRGKGTATSAAEVFLAHMALYASMDGSEQTCAQSWRVPETNQLANESKDSSGRETKVRPIEKPAIASAVPRHLRVRSTKMPVPKPISNTVFNELSCDTHRRICGWHPISASPLPQDITVPFYDGAPLPPKRTPRKALTQRVTQTISLVPAKRSVTGSLIQDSFMALAQAGKETKNTAGSKEIKKESSLTRMVKCMDAVDHNGYFSTVLQKPEADSN